jgi:hypothetical protein
MMQHAEVVKIVTFKRPTRLQRRRVFYREIFLLFLRLGFELRVVRKSLFIEFLVAPAEITIRVFEEFLSRTFVRFAVGFDGWSEPLRKRLECEKL